MKLDFATIPEEVIPHFKGGEKEIATRMFWDGSTRIKRARLAPGASIGLHRHEGTSEAIYVLSGRERVLLCRYLNKYREDEWVTLDGGRVLTMDEERIFYENARIMERIG